MTLVTRDLEELNSIIAAHEAAWNAAFAAAVNDPRYTTEWDYEAHSDAAYVDCYNDQEVLGSDTEFEVELAENGDMSDEQVADIATTCGKACREWIRQELDDQE